MGICEVSNTQSERGRGRVDGRTRIHGHEAGGGDAVLSVGHIHVSADPLPVSVNRGGKSTLRSGEQLRRRLSSWLLLVIDIRKLLSVMIANNKASGRFFNWTSRVGNDEGDAASGGQDLRAFCFRL